MNGDLVAVRIVVVRTATRSPAPKGSAGQSTTSKNFTIPPPLLHAHEEPVLSTRVSKASQAIPRVRIHNSLSYRGPTPGWQAGPHPPRSPPGRSPHTTIPGSGDPDPRPPLTKPRLSVPQITIDEEDHTMYADSFIPAAPKASDVAQNTTAAADSDEYSDTEIASRLIYIRNQTEPPNASSSSAEAYTTLQS